MTRATSTNFNNILYSVALIFIFKKLFGSCAEKGWAPRTPRIYSTGLYTDTYFWKKINFLSNI